ncbi:MAG: glycosyltransferase family 2 protein [Nitrospiraceae bacterium]|nr:glycosyltransferase family 2 protein [Nitrospiraceae bacterium]
MNTEGAIQPEQLLLSVVMPCLNEAETIGSCIGKARKAIDEHGLVAEIIVADNGSTDGSIEIAEKLGARVVAVPVRGYGAALSAGIAASRGRYIIMGDSDDSYDFGSLMPFVEKLQEGYDLVMGCRLPSGGGTIMPGAMPWKNRWIGNPSLSNIGRFFFRIPVRDFHCGMRGFTREAFQALDLHTTGMEFASEMVIKAGLLKLRITEIPITLYPAGRSRPPHLRPWRDGWRHLRFMLLYSPRWLFFIPGLVLLALGAAAFSLLVSRPVTVGTVTFDTNTLLMSVLSVITGYQLIIFYIVTRTFVVSAGLVPHGRRPARTPAIPSLEAGILLSILMIAAGAAFLVQAVRTWAAHDFGQLSYPESLRMVIPAAMFILLGVQSFFSSFLIGIIKLPRK